MHQLTPFQMWALHVTLAFAVIVVPAGNLRVPQTERYHNKAGD